MNVEKFIDIHGHMYFALQSDDEAKKNTKCIVNGIKTTRKFGMEVHVHTFAFLAAVNQFVVASNAHTHDELKVSEVTKTAEAYRQLATSNSNTHTHIYIHLHSSTVPKYSSKERKCSCLHSQSYCQCERNAHR